MFFFQKKKNPQNFFPPNLMLAPKRIWKKKRTEIKNFKKKFFIYGGPTKKKAPFGFFPQKMLGYHFLGFYYHKGGEKKKGPNFFFFFDPFFKKFFFSLLSGKFFKKKEFLLEGLFNFKEFFFPKNFPLIFLLFVLFLRPGGTQGGVSPKICFFPPPQNFFFYAWGGEKHSHKLGPI